jgi:hypothetical protein
MPECLLELYVARTDAAAMSSAARRAGLSCDHVAEVVAESHTEENGPCPSRM